MYNLKNNIFNVISTKTLSYIYLVGRIWDKYPQVWWIICTFLKASFGVRARKDAVYQW